MKNIILKTMLIVVTLSNIQINADSCGVKKKSYKNQGSSCHKPVNHTNRKQKSCGKDDNSCAKKNVRQNKYARMSCCE